MVLYITYNVYSGRSEKHNQLNRFCFEITVENRRIASFNELVQFALHMVIHTSAANDLFVIHVVGVIRTIAPVGLSKVSL